jgi:hypothetical protein
MRIAFALFVAVVLIGCEAEAPPDEVVDVVADPQPKEKPTTVKKNNVEEPAVDEPKPGDEEVKPEKQPKPKVQEGPSDEELLAAEARKSRDAAISAIKELGGTTKLDESSEDGPVVGVVLSFTPITDAGLKQLKGLPQLKSLQLRATSVTDAGIVHLKELKNLQEVILNGTLVTDAGVNDLQTALPNCTIRR